ncbi:hypothetical protein HPB52_018824 [Rhipicephalus sanguineus]|uniref:Endonuclease/exonuclease/phosphatase domain-containing protein n=1 Tax=Rhipicephalus sanguineus TaxID=34632 RepID=A0A9D4SUQ3_RHISA|nr:hypothetical protein HPB52_018824 [Rhipicephalus sanguineus]
MSAVRASFQDMFTAALTQALPEIVAQVSDSVLKAVKPWVSTQIKNTTQCEPPQLKRKTASRQAVEEYLSGLAPGGPVRPLWRPRRLQARAGLLHHKDPLVIVGDFNAPSLHWGYHYEQARGRKLAGLISTLRLTLLTDPAYPTRMGNSVTRDTCPDLSLVKNAKDATWENLGDSLGSDHCLLRVTLLEKPAHKKMGSSQADRLATIPQ